MGALDPDSADRVSELRPVYLPLDPASRTTYKAGELAQFDFWFPPIELRIGFGRPRTEQLPASCRPDRAHP